MLNRIRKMDSWAMAWVFDTLVMGDFSDLTLGRCFSCTYFVRLFVVHALYTVEKVTAEKYLNCIKAVRTITGMPLKEAKAFTDNCRYVSPAKRYDVDRLITLLTREDSNFVSQGVMDDCIASSLGIEVVDLVMLEEALVSHIQAEQALECDEYDDDIPF